MRIVFPHLLIPASLDVDGLAGLGKRLEAGANVITSLVPPGQGLAGVAQNALDIEDGRRTPESIAQTLLDLNLEPASSGRFRQWMEERKRAVFRRGRCVEAAC
jgi:methylornithine synthase